VTLPNGIIEVHGPEAQKVMDRLAAVWDAPERIAAFLRDVGRWGRTSAGYEKEHVKSGTAPGREYHRGAKEAYERVVDAMPKFDVHTKTPDDFPPQEKMSLGENLAVRSAISLAIGYLRGDGASVKAGAQAVIDALEDANRLLAEYVAKDDFPPLVDPIPPMPDPPRTVAERPFRTPNRERCQAFREEDGKICVLARGHDGSHRVDDGPKKSPTREPFSDWYVSREEVRLIWDQFLIKQHESLSGTLAELLEGLPKHIRQFELALDGLSAKEILHELETEPVTEREREFAGVVMQMLVRYRRGLAGGSTL